MVHTTGFVVEDDGFASVATRAVPSVGWFKRVVHDQAKRPLIEDAGVEHLSVPWFKHSQFLMFTWKQNHGQDEQRQRVVVHAYKAVGLI